MLRFSPGSAEFLCHQGAVPVLTESRNNAIVGHQSVVSPAMTVALKKNFKLSSSGCISFPRNFTPRVFGKSAKMDYNVLSPAGQVVIHELCPANPVAKPFGTLEKLNTLIHSTHQNHVWLFHLNFYSFRNVLWGSCSFSRPLIWFQTETRARSTVSPALLVFVGK